jgi:hypothetical protein
MLMYLKYAAQVKYLNNCITSCNNIDKMKYVGLLILSVWRLLVYYRAYVNLLKICCASEVFEQVQIASLSHLLIFVYSCLIFKVHTLNCCNQSFISSFFSCFIPFKFL